jgi:hypothetical protein
MTDIEVRKALAMLQENYPHFMDGRKFDATKSLWMQLFANDTSPVVEAAILAFIASDNKGFPPSIGQIKEKIAQMDNDGVLDEAGAWALVYAAMCKGATEKEFNKLPCDIQRVVGTQRILFDWSMMDIETVNSVVASNFMRSYRARAVHTREIKKLPESVRALYAAVGDAFSMDRALPAPEKKPEPPEASQVPESVKGQLDELREKVKRDEAEAAHKQTKLLMQRMFGITAKEENA